MAVALFAISLFSALGLISYILITRLRKNIALARATGLPYVVVPFYITSVPWLLLQPIVLPFLERRPEAWTRGCLPLLFFRQGWNYGYEPFRTFGADTFMAVSPTRNVIHTCDPDVSAQIFRRSEFGKPVELIELLNVFGPGLTGSEGANGRLYRRITSPFFADQIMDQTWRTSIDSAGALMHSFAASQGSNKPGKGLRAMLANMTLHNVFTVCFESSAEKQSFRQRESVPAGHRIGFRQAVLSTLDHIATIAFTPKFILELSPLPSHKEAHFYSSEVLNYLSDLWKSSHSSGRSQNPEVKEANLLGQWHSLTSSKPSNSDCDLPDLLVRADLPPPAVKGNIFSFLFAGHEANANTLTFALYLLALHPSIQRSVQRTIDTHLAHGSLQGSAYKTHYPLFKDSIVAAVINETLRLYTILPYLPKVTPELPSSLTVNGRPHALPPNTLILINTSATHRHPGHWPAPQAPLNGSAPYPVSSFNPGFWLQSQQQQDSGHFLRPRPGSFIPFSDGARGCLGRQFAMVELCAQLVAIFREWDVELVEDEETGWEGARLRAEEIMSKDVVFDMTLRPGKAVPIQFTKRKVKRDVRNFFPFQ